MLIVKRREEKRLRDSKGWILVYGRRKVGKSFLIKRAVKWDLYITVTRSRDAILEEEGNLLRIELTEGIKRAVNCLKEDKTVVIDEFQRLPEFLWDEIALLHPSGRLILAGSSHGIVRKVLDRRSPLLGLVNPIKMGIISYSDAVFALSSRVNAEKALLWGVLIRDPWIIPFSTVESDPVLFLADNAEQLVISCSGLVGEVFTEEDRALTSLYETVLRLLAEGIWNPSEIAGILSSRGMLEGGAPAVTGVLDKLVKMGLVDKIKLWKTRRSRVYYRHSSPLLSIAYYLDQKFGISDGYRVKEGSVVRSVFGREVEYCIAEMLANELGGIPGFHVSPEGDVDVIIFRGGKAIFGYEVKMGIIERREARKAVERVHELGIPRAGLISLKEKPPEIEGAFQLIGPEDLVRIAERQSSSHFLQEI
ncbi:MAG: AAA family ATPase [Candidatus Methanodesulfokora sp.]|jgi:hypothetical protein